MTIREIVDGQAGLPVPNSTKSYWHREPSEKLFGHRTTADLPEKADVVIVGSGLTGSFAAHFLKNGKARDERVLVLEAREACWGATGRNGGHCQPFLYASTQETAEFELETYFFIRDFVSKNNIDCSWRTVSGVHAFLTEEVWELASQAVAHLSETSPELAKQVTVVTPAGSSDGSDLTFEKLRLRNPDVKGAVIQKNAASLWPYKLVSWILETLLEDFPAPSFNLQTNTPVTAIKKQEAPSAQYPWIVQTPRGAIAARNVLLATNAYTSRLLPLFADLIVPVRGQVGALVPPTKPAVGLEHSYVNVGEVTAENGQPRTRNEYLVQRPRPDGELILGGGRHLAEGLAVGEWHDDVVEESVSRHLRQELEPWLDLRSSSVDGGAGTTSEEKNGLEALIEWTGIMGYSLDHNPWVGPVPESLGGGDGLWLCAGYTGHGMPHAALCARGVVRMMKEEQGNHGVPADFVVSRERVEEARRVFESVMSTEQKGVKALFATSDIFKQTSVGPGTNLEG